MHAAALYLILVGCGGVAYWRCGLLYRWVHINGFTGRLVTPDPVDCPLFIVYTLTPLPGLTALADFLYAVWRRTHRPTYADRKRMMP